MQKQTALLASGNLISEKDKIKMQIKSKKKYEKYREINIPNLSREQKIKSGKLKKHGTTRFLNISLRVTVRLCIKLVSRKLVEKNLEKHCLYFN